LPPAGSNGFGWSFRAGNGQAFNASPQACVMADPHGGGRDRQSLGGSTDPLDFAARRRFAHIKLNQSVEPIDFFGYFERGTGICGFFTKSVGFGGSLAACNASDAVLLRLKATRNAQRRSSRRR